jgi:hypothetical protein
MNNHTADDIYVLNEYYLQYYCHTEQQHVFLIDFLRYHGLVPDYFHHPASRE